MAASTLVEDLARIEQALLAVQKKATKKSLQESLKRGHEAVSEAAKAFCGSWLGYHSRVYYEDLQPPPPGAHFSAQWGLMRDVGETQGHWVECDSQQLFDYLKDGVGEPTLDEVADAAEKIFDETKDLREELLSVLDSCLSRGDDAYLQKMKKAAEAARVQTTKERAKANTPPINLVCYDQVAASQGVLVPPHINLLAQIEMLESCLDMPGALAQVAKRTASHLSKKQSARGSAGKQGTKVFIGPRWFGGMARAERLHRGEA